MTPEYIELCRRLALPREWQEGDSFTWRFEWGRGKHSGFVGVLPNGWVTEKGNPYRQLGDPPYPPRPSDPGGPVGVWLPREGDILDLLEAEGYVQAALWPCDLGQWAGTSRLSPIRPPAWDFEVIAGDRLSALLKLYMAVKNIDITDPDPADVSGTPKPLWPDAPRVRDLQAEADELGRLSPRPDVSGTPK